MRKEEIVSGFVMFIVSGLVLVGFTIAWYTVWHSPVVTGIQVQAAEIGDINVEIDDSDMGELAPGASGTITISITPTDGNVMACRVEPQLLISQDGTNWYSGEAAAKTLAELYEIAGRHIQFFSNAAMTAVIDEENPLQLTWTAEEGSQKKTTEIYWKWHYIYPLSAEEEALTEAEQETLLDAYDLEDMELGNNISHMKFDFTFSIQ